MTIEWSHGSDTVPPAIASVCATATVRFANNPEGLLAEDVEGDSFVASEFGFTLAELQVLNRYRRRTWP